MHNDESIVNFFLRIDGIVNWMKNMGEEIKDTTLVDKILRYLMFPQSSSLLKNKPSYGHMFPQS